MVSPACRCSADQSGGRSADVLEPDTLTRTCMLTCVHAHFPAPTHTNTPQSKHTPHVVYEFPAYLSAHTHSLSVQTLISSVGLVDACAPVSMTLRLTTPPAVTLHRTGARRRRRCANATSSCETLLMSHADVEVRQKLNASESRASRCDTMSKTSTAGRVM